MPNPTSITKSEAIKRAIEAGASLPTEGVAYIKKHFGLDVTTGFFSKVKGELANQVPVRAVTPLAPIAASGFSSKSAVIRKPAAPASKSTVMRKPAPAAKSFVMAKPASAVKPIDPVALAREVKGLVERYGVDAVKGMADIVKG